VTGNDVTLPQVTRSHPEVVSRDLPEMVSRDLRRPEVTRKLRHLTGSHLEVAVEGRKLAYAVHFASYKAVARITRQLRDRK